MKPERGLTIGVFDLFHVGHLRYLQFASRQCSHLVVAVTPDCIAEEMKGRRPVIPQEQRMEIVLALDIVAEVRPLPSTTENTETAAIWIDDWDIQHVIAGGGWKGSDRWARLVPALTRQGITVDFAPHTEFISTTQIIDKILGNLA